LLQYRGLIMNPSSNLVSFIWYTTPPGPDAAKVVAGCIGVDGEMASETGGIFAVVAGDRTVSDAWKPRSSLREIDV
jgi:hypothetical protein